MKEQLISLEVAKFAKSKGFNPSNCLVKDFYEIDGERQYGMEMGFSKEPYDKDIHIAKITQSLLQKWLRDNHSLHIGLSVNQFGYGFMYSIIDMKKCDCVKHLTGGVNDKFTFEGALEAGLKQTLELI